MIRPGFTSLCSHFQTVPSWRTTAQLHLLHPKSPGFWWKVWAEKVRGEEDEETADGQDWVLPLPHNPPTMSARTSFNKTVGGCGHGRGPEMGLAGPQVSMERLFCSQRAWGFLLLPGLLTIFQAGGHFPSASHCATFLRL